MFKSKFTEVKTLIKGKLFPQSLEELDNGIGQVDTAKVDFENIKAKLIDKLGDDELFLDFQNVIDSYLN